MLRLKLQAMQTVVRLLERERQVLTRFDAEALTHVADEKLAAANALDALTRECQNVLERYANSFGIRGATRVAALPEACSLTQAIDAEAARATALNMGNRELLARYAGQVAAMKEALHAAACGRRRRGQCGNPSQFGAVKSAYGHSRWPERDSAMIYRTGLARSSGSTIDSRVISQRVSAMRDPPPSSSSNPD